MCPSKVPTPMWSRRARLAMPGLVYFVRLTELTECWIAVRVRGPEGIQPPRYCDDTARELQTETDA